MGLITHNRIYVCISASPCPVIVDLVIIGSVGSLHHYASESPVTASWVPLSPPRSRSTSPWLAAGGQLAIAPLQAVAPVGGRPLQGAWPQPTAPLQGGLGCSRPPPCRWLGYALLSLLLVAFAAKPQQERVEQFYTIQSHHMKFKTNLSHENLGSDTTVGKPQRVHYMWRSYIPVFQIRMEKMKEVKRPPL
ncbi:hypothetical protein B296_00043810 [Ensete ventricosum]|uniref:Uncharacterized protein n=1 Tax=Ensete ventricosum TaxID=4639 RepID=A0A426X0N0_ENSVE|nr:hypothetical protein B296_00043810 [Ensete ventricosum]